MIRKLFLTALLAVTPAIAGAAEVGTYGPRIGFSSGPDQIVFGGQYAVAEVADHLTFDPNLELGFGDDATIIAFNLDLHYEFQTNTTWRPYAGAGIGISFVSFDAPPPANDESDTDVGGALIIGAEAPPRGNGRFFGELKLGLGDIPDLKLMVGWNFKR
jgi:opacity protein-like surface antigen